MSHRHCSLGPKSLRGSPTRIGRLEGAGAFAAVLPCSCSPFLALHGRGFHSHTGLWSRTSQPCRPQPRPEPHVQLKVPHLAEGPVCPAGQHAPKQSWGALDVRPNQPLWRGRGRVICSLGAFEFQRHFCYLAQCLYCHGLNSCGANSIPGP